MSGKMSRRKGLRVEYVVRDYFRSLGYECHRVPSSGAAQGFKGDLVVSKDGKDFKVEVKARASTFDTIYKFFDKNKNDFDSLYFGLGDGILVAMSRHFEQVTSLNVHFWHYHKDNSTSQDLRLLRRITNLRQYLGECDYLAIKRDRGPIIFLRFWGSPHHEG